MLSPGNPSRRTKCPFAPGRELEGVRFRVMGVSTKEVCANLQEVFTYKLCTMVPKYDCRDSQHKVTTVEQTVKIFTVLLQ